MTFRVRDETRDEIASAAAQNNRSISEEIEYRLLHYNKHQAFTESLFRHGIDKAAEKHWNESNRKIAADFVRGVLKERFTNILHSSALLKMDVDHLVSIFEEFGLDTETGREK